MVLRGEAGIGKTALLEYLVASASDLHVVRAVGVESEMELDLLGYISCVRRCSEPNKDFASLPEFVLQGLTDPDALKLLNSVVKDPLDARVSKRIITETRGNPLALLELSGELGAARFMDDLAPRDESSVSDQIEDSFQRRIEELPSDTQLLLLIAAAERARCARARRRGGL